MNISKTSICLLISFIVLNPLIGVSIFIEYHKTSDNSDYGLIYSTLLGGSESEIGWGIATDSNDNFYITAVTPSLDFPLVNEINNNLTGENLFVAKFNSTGNLLFSTIVGGHGFVNVATIAIDPLTDDIVIGANIQYDNLETKDALQDDFGGETDCVIIKLASVNLDVIFSTYFGGSNFDIIHDINVDAEGNIILAGMTQSANFPTVNAYQSSKGSAWDAFLTKITQDGQSILFSTFYGGNGVEEEYGAYCDSDNNILISGLSTSTNLEMKNAFQSSYGGGFRDGFVAKYNENGSLQFASYLGGSNEDWVMASNFDNEGNMILTGRTLSQNFVTTDGVIQENHSTYSGDAFVTKLTPNGSLLFSTLFGGGGDDGGFAITSDSDNNIIFSGESGSWLLPVTNANNSQSDYGGGSHDSYLTILNTEGTEILFMTYIGGTGKEFGWGITLTKSEEIIVAGYTTASNFPTVNGYQSELGGEEDIYICKYGPHQENSSNSEEDDSTEAPGFDSGIMVISLILLTRLVRIKKNLRRET